jgi:predicted RNA methylase
MECADSSRGLVRARSRRARLLDNARRIAHQVHFAFPLGHRSQNRLDDLSSSLQHQGFQVSRYREYWEKNISQWAEFYLDISHGHETLEGPSWLGRAYNATIAKYEARLMRDRFELTRAFIEENVHPGVVLADIGCGTGIFVVKAARRGASVEAIDFSTESLKATRANVERHTPDAVVHYHQLDVQKDRLPRSDVAIMVGVTPYLSNLSGFLDCVLASTNLLFCQYVDPCHWANRLRRTVPVLNVRRLVFHNSRDVDGCYAEHGWRLDKRFRFATGYVDIVRSPNPTNGRS